MKKAIVCDFGGVLTTPLVDSFMHYQEVSGISWESVGKAMQKVMAETGLHPLFELEKGLMTEEEFLRTIEEAMEEDVSLRTLAETYFAHLDRNEEMIALIGSLRADGVRTALLTNNVREWEARWRAMMPELDEVFEFVVDSAFVGMRKPDPGIYALTVKRFGGDVEYADCVFVDDIDVNCDTARELGMQPVRFVSNDQAIPEIRAAFASRG